MKKAIFLLVMILMVVPFVSSYTEFNRPFVQDKCSSEGTGDCFTGDSYGLRDASYYTGIEYNSTDWDYCSVPLGGSAWRGVPFSYYATTGTFDYEHHSMIVLDTGSIKQYDSDCNVIDNYAFTGVPLSQVGIINSGFPAIDGDVSESNLPYFAFIYNNTLNEDIYLAVLTLDYETSTFRAVRDDELFANGSAYASIYFVSSETLGMAGGVYLSEINTGIPELMTFALVSLGSGTDAITIIYGKNQSTDDLFSVSKNIILTGYGMTTAYNTHHQLYFDDWDADGNNEYIIFGGDSSSSTPCRTDLEMLRVVPLPIAPYYTVEARVTEDIISDGCSGNNVATTDLGSDGAFTLCQIGMINSPMELCYNTYDTATDSRVFCQGFLANNFTDGFAPTLYECYRTTTATAARPMAPFTMTDPVSGTENFFCTSSYDLAISTSYDMDIVCYDESYDVRYAFNISGSPISTSISYRPMEMILTELNGDTSSKELLRASGEVDSLVNGSNSIARTDWESTHDASYTGMMYVQDISGDGISELIYIDDTRLKIYTMTPGDPFILMNWTSEGSYFSTTTTTLSGSVPYNEIPDIFESVTSSIQTWIGLALILALAIIGGVYGKGHPILIGLGAIIGSIIALTIGLISGAVMLLIILSMVLLVLLGFTIFKPGGN